MSRTPSRGVVDTSVDPLWSAIRHSCGFLCPKCRLPPGCDFFLCSFRLLFSCNFLLPISFSISFLPGAYLCCQAFELPLEVWELLFSSYTFWQFVPAVHCSNWKEFFLVSVPANCFTRHLSPTFLQCCGSGIRDPVPF